MVPTGASTGVPLPKLRATTLKIPKKETVHLDSSLKFLARVDDGNLTTLCNYTLSNARKKH